MTRSAKKTIWSILAVAAVAALAVAAFHFRRGYRLPPVLPDTAELTPATVAHPGRPALADARRALLDKVRTRIDPSVRFGLFGFFF